MFLILHPNGSTLCGERKGLRFHIFPISVRQQSFHSSQPQRKREKQAHQTQQAHPTTPRTHNQKDHRSHPEGHSTKSHNYPNPPQPLLLCRNPAVLKILNSFNILPCSFVPTCSGVPQLINLGPIFCFAQPEHFLHQMRTSPCLSILLTTLCPPRCRFPHYPMFL